MPSSQNPMTRLDEYWREFVVHKDVPDRIYDWPRTRANIQALHAHAKVGDTLGIHHVRDCFLCYDASLPFAVATGWPRQVWFFRPWSAIKMMTLKEIVDGGLPTDKEAHELGPG